MGNFYTNIVLRGAPREAALACLKKLRRDAFVSPTEDDATVVYDAESEDQDLGVLDRLAAKLTKRLRCVALCFLNHDDDMLVCLLFRNGARIAQWVWDPTGFLEGTVAADPPPAFADAVAHACGCGASGVSAVLTDAAKPPLASEQGGAAGADAVGGPVFAWLVHQALVEALGFGRYSVGLGYRGVKAGRAKELFGAEDEFAELEPATPQGTEAPRGAAPRRRRRKRWMFSFYTYVGLRGCPGRPSSPWSRNSGGTPSSRRRTATSPSSSTRNARTRTSEFWTRYP